MSDRARDFLRVRMGARTTRRRRRRHTVELHVPAGKGGDIPRLGGWRKEDAARRDLANFLDSDTDVKTGAVPFGTVSATAAGGIHEKLDSKIRLTLSSDLISKRRLRHAVP